MKQVVILSGKGGTGKTSVAAALAHAASRRRRLVLVDADADAANLGLLLATSAASQQPFFGSPVALIRPDECVGCGECADVCRFDAITRGLPCHVDVTACEGCGACVLACPTEVVRMVPLQAGWQRCSESLAGPLYDGDLIPGRENSGKLVAELRQVAGEAARDSNADLLLIDGPPGIGCPAIAASTGADLALLVCEPSRAALHDLQRILETTRHLQVPAVALLNKADLHEALAEEVRAFLREEGVPLLAELPYLEQMHEAVLAGRPATAMGDDRLNALFDDLVAHLEDALRSPPATRRTAAAG